MCEMTKTPKGSHARHRFLGATGVPEGFQFQHKPGRFWAPAPPFGKDLGTSNRVINATSRFNERFPESRRQPVFDEEDPL